MKSFTLDTSALLCFLRNEKGAEIVQDLFDRKDFLLHMHRVNLGELYYGVFKKDGEILANRLYGYLIQYPIHYISDLSDRFLLTVARFKTNFNLGYADAYAAATSSLQSAILVTKDNDFRSVQKAGVLEILWT